MNLMIAEKGGGLKMHFHTKSYLHHDSSYPDGWTFGILTAGRREKILQQMVGAIRDQKIPNYEIIICGKTDISGKDIIRIDFPDEKFPQGWITRKKNIIVEAAKYENICILHDRIVLDKNWYREMKKYGNNWQVLGCRVVQIDRKNKSFDGVYPEQSRGTQGKRAGDWLTVGSDDWHDFKMGYLDYRDWDENVYIGSGLTMVKKSIAGKVKWNEELFRTDNEDIDFHRRMTKMGYKTTINPGAQAFAYFWRFGELPYYPFVNGKRGKLTGMPVRLFWAGIFRAVYRSPFKILATAFYDFWHKSMRGGVIWKLLNR